MALSVLVFHAQLASGMLLKGLFWAVPCFLGISGFLVLQSFERSRNVWHFALKRVTRVLPAMLVSLFLVYVLFGSLGLRDTLLTYVTLGFIPESPNGAIWSLGWEELFYAFLAVASLVGLYRKPILAWAGLLITSGVAFYFAPGAWDPVQRALVLPPAFFIGNILYLERARIAQFPAWIAALSFTILLCVGLQGSIHDLPTSVRIVHQLLLVAACIWFGFAGPPVPNPIPLDLSYGIYIYAYPIQSFLVQKRGVHTFVPLVSTTLAITAVIALASAICVERPAIKSRSSVPINEAA